MCKWRDGKREDNWWLLLDLRQCSGHISSVDYSLMVRSVQWAHLQGGQRWQWWCGCDPVRMSTEASKVSLWFKRKRLSNFYKHRRALNALSSLMVCSHLQGQWWQWWCGLGLADSERMFITVSGVFKREQHNWKAPAWILMRPRRQARCLFDCERLKLLYLLNCKAQYLIVNG